MKLQASTLILGLMFSINSQAQVQESTANTSATPAVEESTTTTTTQPNGQQIERVEVIGSRIKRIQKEGAAPVKNVGKESMKNSANTTASDSLRDSSMAVNGANRESSGGSAAATATIGLRGLGDTRTLVLLNGHRLPRDPSFEAVDLNLIPQAAIERIEVLKDGASALYGSDALGGVINIVTKKGYVGNEASLKFSGVEKPGGSTYDVALLSGIAGEKTDLLVALNYNHSDKVFGKDREYTKDGFSSNGTVPAYIIPVANGGTGKWILTDPGACPPDLFRSNSSGQRCGFRYNEIATTRPQIGQISLLTDVSHRFDSGLKFYNRNIVVHKDIEWSYAPTPIGIDTDIPNGTQSQPNVRTISYRFMEAGNRDQHDTELNFNALFGLKGNVTSIWEYDVSAGYGEINRKNQGTGGYINKDTLLALIAGNSYDPLAPGGPTGSMKSAIQNPWNEQRTSLLTVDTVFTGELGELESGAIGVATGVSYFNEKLDLDSDEASAREEIIGSSGSKDRGSRDVGSVFAEVSLPMSESFELDAAARFDQYSDFGSTVNPKLSAKYTINPSVLVRGSVGTGFKAPTLSQLYGGKSQGFLTFIDRRMCATDPDFCEAQQYYVEGGGNKNLKEEKAIAASLGTVLQIGTGTSFSLDVWYTKIDNLVDLDYEELTAAELKDPSSPAANGIIVERDTTTGAIKQITAINLNLAQKEVSGLDFNFESVLAEGVLGHQLFVENDLTYMLFNKYSGYPGAPARDILNEWGNPKWRNTLAVGLRSDVSSLSLSMRTIPAQNIMDRTIDEKISDLNEFDLAAGYKFTPNSQLTGGVKNIMDAKQPLDSFGGAGGIAEINTDLYDVNGRKFYVGYTQKF